MPDLSKLTDAQLERYAQKLMTQRDDLRAEQLRVKAARDERILGAAAKKLLAGMTPGQVDAIAYAARASASATARDTT